MRPAVLSQSGAVVAIVALLAAGAAGAAPRSTTTLTASALVGVGCLVNATNLNFGNIGTSITANVGRSATVTVNCPALQSYTIAIGAGSGVGATPTMRKLTRNTGTETLNFSVYRNVARTQLWGNTIGTDTVSSTGTGADQVFTAYGRIPAGQTAIPGNYTDVLVVTIDY
jgi:spore coat protein U-like protein